MRILIFWIAVIVVFSCSKKKVNKSDQLIGTWQNTSLDVKMDTHKNSDTVNYLHITEGQWENVLKIQPIKTSYLKDGSYSSIYKNLEGIVVHTANGTWEMEGDSLYLVESGITYRYHVTFGSSKARFTGLIDWDQDGLADDHYDGWQKKNN